MPKNTFLIFAVALVAAACSGCGGSGASAQGLTVTQGIDQLVAAGVMPKLDTSTSLLGADADGNGVRDDIDAYIASLPDTPVQKRALTQSAAAINTTLTVDISNKVALDAVGVSLMRAVFCGGNQYKGSSDGLDLHLQNLQKYTINTKSRFSAYQAYNKTRGGSSTGLTGLEIVAACD
jgi:ABC-type glycerol-3-phosphate transport system substrate-binding protein